MAQNLSIFPLFDEDSYSGIFDSNPFEFKFIRPDNSEGELILDNGCLKDSQFDEKYGGDWDVNKTPLRICRKYTIEDADKLYGANGLVCSDAKIGLCVLWKSSTSFQRGVFKVGLLENIKNKQELDFIGTLPQGTMRGNMTLTTALYVAVPGNPSPKELHLRHNIGDMLGEVDDFFVSFEDNLSVMPIKNIGLGKDEPLWKLICNWDSVTDSFNESVSVVLNVDNDYYPFIDKTKDTFNIHFLREILASAFIQIIERYKKEEPDLSALETLAKENIGSVAHVVWFYKNNIEISMEDSISDSIIIRKHFEKLWKRH